MSQVWLTEKISDHVRLEHMHELIKIAPLLYL